MVFSNKNKKKKKERKLVLPVAQVAAVATVADSSWKQSQHPVLMHGRFGWVSGNDLQ